MVYVNSRSWSHDLDLALEMLRRNRCRVCLSWMSYLRDTLLVLTSEKNGPGNATGVLALEEKRLALAVLEAKNLAVTTDVELALLLSQISPCSYSSVQPVILSCVSFMPPSHPTTLSSDHMRCSLPLLLMISFSISCIDAQASSIQLFLLFFAFFLLNVHHSRVD